MLYSFTLFMAQAGPYGSRPYDMNSFISYDFYGVAYRCFGSAVFWLVALILVPVACAALQLSIKIVHLEWFPDVNDIGRELDKGYKDGTTPTSGDAYVAGFSLAGLFDCRRAEAQVSHGVEIIASMARGARHSSSTQVSHKDLAATISGMDSPGRLGVQDSGQAQTAVRYNRDQAAEQSFYAPKKNGGAPP